MRSVITRCFRFGAGLCVPVVAVFLATSDMACAEATATEKIVAEMAAQGLSDIRVRRTFIGRTKILGLSEDQVRLVILDPTTGHVFKDRIGPRSALEQKNTPDGTGTSVDGNPD